MKVLAGELLEALSKVGGIVNDKQVIQDLRSFHLLPEEDGYLKVAGTDSNTTLIEKVKYEPSENSDGSLLVLSADKIMDVVRYAGEELEFIYKEDEDGVTVKTATNAVTLFKHPNVLDDVINFDLVKENEFVDEVDADELKGVLNRLTSVIDSSSTDPSFKTVFLTKKEAVVGDEAIISKISFETNGEYEISFKVAKQIISLLGYLEEDSKVKIKKIDEDSKILIMTDLDVMSFGVSDVIEPDLEIVNDFESDYGVFVGKDDLIRGIHLVKATSDEDRIFIHANSERLELTSFNQGEEAKDDIKVFKAEIKKEVKIESLAPELLKLINIIDIEGVVIALDTESMILQVRDAKKNVVSSISVNIED